MLKRLFLLMLSPCLLFAAAQKEQLSTAKTKTSPLLIDVAGGQKGVQNIILDYLAAPDNIILSKTIELGWPVKTISYSPDGKYIAVGGSPDGKILILNPKTGAVQAELKGHGAKVNSVVYSPDGKLIASGSDDKTVKVWDAAKLQHISTIAMSSEVTTVAFDTDLNIIWLALKGGQIRQITREFGYSEKYTRCDWEQPLLAINPKCNLIASTQAQEVCINSTDRPLTRHYSMPTNISAIAFRPGHKQIAIGFGGNVRIMDFEKNWQVTANNIHIKEIRVIAYSPDGRFIASGSDDGAINIGDAEAIKLINTLAAHSDPVLSLAFSPNGNELVSGSADGTIKIWKRQDIAMAEAEEVDQ